ncbi:MAG: biliverdin-producing heme oxygenase [Hyphomicrobiales bacterium]|nr:biliverdin-producing heme oxygenase [Hyphomicrobiales bacterium]
MPVPEIKTLHPNGELLAQLRTATKTLHETIDGLVDMEALADPSVYKRFLSSNYAALAPVERALYNAGIETLFPDWPIRRRTAALQADLDELDVSLPELLFCPELQGRGAMLGAMYVLEGSRMGAYAIGGFLDKNTAEHLPRRFIVHGRDRSLWPAFKQRLSTQCLSTRETGDALAAAQDTFRVFIAAFTQTFAAAGIS